MSQSYAGDISSKEAWRMLEEGNAALIDVRTQPEWNFVGVPDLSSLGQQARFIEWQAYPNMAVNPEFTEAVKAAEVRPDQTVLLLCRSGARSRNAAMALTAAGFERCFNLEEGFEGPHDADGHRGTQIGWKAAGLPWKQG